jgi:hypothetical protein
MGVRVSDDVRNSISDLFDFAESGSLVRGASGRIIRAAVGGGRGIVRRELGGFLAVATALLPFLPNTGGAVDGPDALRDGQHDFDFEIGTWKTHVSRLLHPLTGSNVWGQYDGTSVVRKVWNGRANLVELEADGPAGHLELVSFRLYNSAAHQWSLNVASSRGGSFGVATIGEFKNGRGEFYDQETFDNRAILVRFVISDITAQACHFEQAFSIDGGKTWEVNWIADDTRVKD